jgi:hypothetical protein
VDTYQQEKTTMPTYRHLLEVAPDHFGARVQELYRLLQDGCATDVARSLYPAIQEHCQDFGDAVLSVMYRATRYRPSGAAASPARFADAVLMVDSALQASLQSIGEATYSEMAKRTWLAEFNLAYRSKVEERSPSLQDAWEIAKVNHHRACERVVIHRFLNDVRYSLGPKRERQGGIAEARESALFAYMFHAVLQQRSTLDRIALMLGGEALAYSRELAFAGTQRYSTMEMLCVDQQLAAYRSSDQDSLTASIAEARDRHVA